MCECVCVCVVELGAFNRQTWLKKKKEKKVRLRKAHLCDIVFEERGKRISKEIYNDFFTASEQLVYKVSSPPLQKKKGADESS